MPITPSALSHLDQWFQCIGPTTFRYRSPGRASPVTITATEFARESMVWYSLTPTDCSKVALDFEIEQGGYIALHDAAGCRIKCKAGHLWITEQDRFGDLTLIAGQELQLSQPRKTLVVATRSSRLSIR